MIARMNKLLPFIITVIYLMAQITKGERQKHDSPVYHDPQTRTCYGSFGSLTSDISHLS